MFAIGFQFNNQTILIDYNIPLYYTLSHLPLSFSILLTGMPLTALHGKIKQERRTIIYMDYVKRNAACLIATDIAARGLDFPNVDWVIQVGGVLCMWNVLLLCVVCCHY